MITGEGYLEPLRCTDGVCGRFRESDEARLRELCEELLGPVGSVGKLQLSKPDILVSTLLALLQSTYSLKKLLIVFLPIMQRSIMTDFAMPKMVNGSSLIFFLQSRFISLLVFVSFVSGLCYETARLDVCIDKLDVPYRRA